MIDVNIDELVENSNGDVAVLYGNLVELFSGDHDKANNALTKLIEQEERRLKESLEVIDEGKKYLERVANIEATREDKAYWTQREYFKVLYHGKPNEVKPVARTKAAKDKQLELEKENKRTAYQEYYSTRPQEALEDNVVAVD